MPVQFRERPAKSIVYVATIRPSAAPPANSVEAGDDVKLYAGTVEVFVKVTKVVAAGDYRGAVIGANTRGAADPGLKPGDEVAFGERQIFTCSKRR